MRDTSKGGAAARRPAEIEARLVAALRARASPERAVQEKRYQKSRWEHWGVAAPDMVRAIRETFGDADGEAVRAVAARLWREPVWDLRLAAARALQLRSVAPDERLWAFVVDRMPDLDGWAVADTLKVAAGRCLIADPARLDRVETWVESPHLWTRRASLVFTLPWTAPGRDPERMLAWAARLLPDREWFIQKAIGWWLRALSQGSPDRVRAFLAEHGGGVRGVARREATRRLPPDAAGPG